MIQPVIKMVLMSIVTLIMTACSSAPSQPDYRYDEQNRGAEKAQKELSREMDKRY